jgi:chromosome partitioning protein
LTVCFGLNPREDRPTITDVLLDPQQTPLPVAIVPAPIPGVSVDLVPASKNLASVSKELDLAIPGWHEILRGQLAAPAITGYDYVVLDTQPDLTLLSTLSLHAADLALIPFQCEYLSMNTLGQLIEFIQKVQERINPGLAYRILFTMFTGHTIHEREVAEEVRARFNTHVLQTTINKTVRFSDSSSVHQPLVFMEPNHKGAEAYRQAWKELAYGQD